MKMVQDINKEELMEIAWKELIQAIKPRDISVNVKNGCVTLSGSVNTYAKKMLTEQIVASVPGVISIQNKIEVKLMNCDKKKDDILTDAILEAFIRNSDEQEEPLAIKIEKDWLTIEGKVKDTYGEEISVKGKICKLENASTRTKVTHHPAIITTSEIAYWEVFG